MRGSFEVLNRPIQPGLFFPSGLGLKLQRDAIHAIAKPGRLRAIGKDMPQMGFAPRASNLGPPHEERAVFILADGIGGDGLVKTRPSRPRLEFRIGRE